MELVVAVVLVVTQALADSVVILELAVTQASVVTRASLVVVELVVTLESVELRVILVTLELVVTQALADSAVILGLAVT